MQSDHMLTFSPYVSFWQRFERKSNILVSQYELILWYSELQKCQQCGQWSFGVSVTRKVSKIDVRKKHSKYQYEQ